MFRGVSVSVYATSILIIVLCVVQDTNDQQRNEHPILLAEPNTDSLLFVTDKRFIFLKRCTSSQPYSLQDGFW